MGAPSSIHAPYFSSPPASSPPYFVYDSSASSSYYYSSYDCSFSLLSLPLSEALSILVSFSSPVHPHTLFTQLRPCTAQASPLAMMRRCDLCDKRQRLRC